MPARFVILITLYYFLPGWRKVSRNREIIIRPDILSGGDKHMKNIILVILLAAMLLHFPAWAVNNDGPALRQYEEILTAGDTAKAISKVFEFSSGGAYHFEGQGSWDIKLDSKGNFNVEHNVRGKVEKFKAYKLTEKETVDFWELVNKADINTLKSSTRQGVPDEVKFKFISKIPGKKDKTVEIWVNDVRKNEKLNSLVNHIGKIIEKYAGKRPVMW